MFEGVGFCAVLIAFFVSFYYNVIIGWAFHFLFSSLSMRLPWKVNFENLFYIIIHHRNYVFFKDCNNDWNTEYCAVKCVNQSETEDSDFASLL